MYQDKSCKVIPPAAHHISPSAVSNSALEVIDTLNRTGYEAYLVGGCVRDLLLNRQPKDFDVATNALPEEIRALFKDCRLIGRRFRLAHVRFGREIIEVATFRAAPDQEGGSQNGEGTHYVSAAGQILRDNQYGTLASDALRRDFSVNALYYDPKEQNIIDYVDGIEDIETKTLRSIGDPKARFREDPVRMLRAVRFSEKLGLCLGEGERNSIPEFSGLLHHVPPARMLDEVLKLFHSGHAGSILKVLRSLDLFRYLFPFTEQHLSDEHTSIAQLGLRNTDQRIKQEKPVIAAFLFACMLWEPMRADLAKILEKKTPFRRAFVIAVEDVLRDQSQYVSIPRRLGYVVKDIWSLQGRLEYRSFRNVMAALSHKRFRAAYDFLLLRAEVGEVSKQLAQWWTEIQEVDDAKKDQMIRQVNLRSRQGRKRKRARAA